MRLLLLVALVALPVSLSAKPLHIMLTNDDGINAPGLRAIKKSLLAAGHRVSVVAPAEQQSGASASFHVGEVSFTTPAVSEWAVESTPATAVYLGLLYFLKDDAPDLVVSGANFGQNVGNGVNMSGTVGASVMAFKLGYPVIAVSVAIVAQEYKDTPRFASTSAAFPDAAVYVADLIARMNSFPGDAFLNINYPALPQDEVKGTKFTTISKASSITGYSLVSPGRVGPIYNPEQPTDTTIDAGALAAGYVSISLLDDSLAVSDQVRTSVTTMLQKIIE